MTPKSPARSSSPDTGCARAWQAGAVLDGRLTGTDRASFERHAATCSVCSHEVRVLAALGTALERKPAHQLTPLELRRRRGRLLERANALVVRAPERGLSTLRYAAVAAAILLVIAIGWGVRSSDRHQPMAAAAAIATPTYRLSTSSRAWQILEKAASVRIELREGQFEFAVDKLSSGQRFLLALPDGELEVQGTRFTVDVAERRTRSVSVQEGRVALRIAGQGDRILLGGEAWPLAADSTDAAADEGHEASRQVARPPASGAHRKPAPDPPDAGVSDRKAPGSEPAADAGSAPSAHGEFTLAMSAFSAGDFARAEALFVAFEQHHPGDGRVEDSTFLRAVARSRRGDTVGAKALAQQYLHDYPKGLRRLEAERLAGGR
jgi:TolA-binding protein